MFEIFPAIDLKNGRAVRLYKGAMQSAIDYGDPYLFAKYFESIGARWIHVVDLDGAFSGCPKNFEIIKKIALNTSIKIQIGGGIRTQKDIQNYLNLGVSRVILGSIALQDRDFALTMAQKYPIAIGIDAQEGMVAINGWQEKKQILAKNFAASFKQSNVQAIICTDISRDGSLAGINIPFTIEIAQESGLFCIASGGFNGEKNLEEIKEIFYKKNIQGGLIIGKAFYEKQVDLPRILKLFS